MRLGRALFDIVKHYHDNCPDEFRPAAGAANAKARAKDGFSVSTVWTTRGLLRWQVAA